MTAVSPPVGTGARREVLITGCSSGIGRCAADVLRGRGYRVFATARREADVDALAAEGFEALCLDLADAESIADAAGRMLSRTEGRVFGLFNNGAFGQPGAVEDLPTPVLRAQFEANFFGWHELTRRLIPAMRRAGEGRIVQNSSVLGLVAMKFRGAYNASKFAVEGLTDTLRLELHGSGIFVSLIEPGPVESRFRENAHAAFRANIDAEASVHRDTYAGVERRLAQRGNEPPFTLPPEAVVDKLVHALESRRPRPRYYVTVPTYAFGVLRRVLSSRMLDRVLHAVAKGENR